MDSPRITVGDAMRHRRVRARLAAISLTVRFVREFTLTVVRGT